MANGNLTKKLTRQAAEALGQRLAAPGSGFALKQGDPGRSACRYEGKLAARKLAVTVHWTAKPKTQVNIVLQGEPDSLRELEAAWFSAPAAVAPPAPIPTTEVKPASVSQLNRTGPAITAMKSVKAGAAPPATVRVSGPAPRGARPVTVPAEAAQPVPDGPPVIGEGGMGRVTLERLADGTPVAVKRLRSALLEEYPEQAQALVERFEREIRAMLLLTASGHPNVVPILRHGADPLPWFAMPLAGQSLDKRLKEIHASLRSIIRTSLQILAGIEAAHEHGIFHRDLKPSNVLLYPDHRGYSAKVADFGLCGMANARRLTATGSSGNGSELYSAPEQRKDLKKADHRADIFSFGVVLFELLTGQPTPIAVRDYLDDDRSQPEIANLTASGRKIIRACVDPTPSRRPTSIAKLREWLWNAATELCNTPDDLDQEQRLELALEFGLPFVREGIGSSAGKTAADRNALFEELERLDSSAAWYVREFPSVQWPDLLHLIQQDPVRFSKRIARFGRAVGEDWLAFSYVDKLGAFLKGLIQSDQSGAALREGLGPMLNLAWRHDRFEVADQVHDFLGGITERDKQKLDSCKSCFAQHPAATKWFLGGKRNRRDELTRFPIGKALPRA